MNFSSIVVLAIIIILVIIAFHFAVRKAGDCSCSLSSSCDGCDKCKNKKSNNKNK